MPFLVKHFEFAHVIIDTLSLIAYSVDANSPLLQEIIDTLVPSAASSRP